MIHIHNFFSRKLLTRPSFFRNQAQCWKLQPSSLHSSHLVNWPTAFYFRTHPKQYPKGLQKPSEHSSVKSSHTILLFFTWWLSTSVTFSSPATASINGPSVGWYKARVDAYSSLHSSCCFLATTSCAEPHGMGYDGCTRPQRGKNPMQWDRQGKSGKSKTKTQERWERERSLFWARL